jgi:predicted phosphohydrolase
LSVVHGVPSMRRHDAPALSSPPKPMEPCSRPSTNHLNPTRDLDEATSQSFRHAVDQAAADDGLADRGLGRPHASMREQVRNRDSQVVIGIHQSRRRRDDPMAVMVGVIGEGEVEAIAHGHDWHHGVRR